MIVFEYYFKHPPLVFDIMNYFSVIRHDGNILLTSDKGQQKSFEPR